MNLKPKKETFETWEEYVSFARECDKDPLFKKALDKFIKLTT